jgi:hypothetical protein
MNIADLMLEIRDEVRLPNSDTFNQHNKKRKGAKQ